MKQKSKTEILIKWNLYTPQQKEVILAEFRKKFPDDYYCKTTLCNFLREKIMIRECQEAVE
jgi:hypothetical protein